MLFRSPDFSIRITLEPNRLLHPPSNIETTLSFSRPAISGISGLVRCRTFLDRRDADRQPIYCWHKHPCFAITFGGCGGCRRHFVMYMFPPWRTNAEPALEPTRQPVTLGRCPRTPRLRGARRGAAPGPRACAAHAGALPLDPAPTRRTPGRCSWPPRLRGARQRALPSGLPLGHSPRPRDAAHLRLACGRDGGFGAVSTVQLTRPARQKQGGPVGFIRNSFSIFTIVLIFIWRYNL